MAKSELPVVDARPTKRFFVRMLVRDIELVPAIVDLIDNSVDGAKRLAGAEGVVSDGQGGELDAEELDLSGRHIHLTLDGDRFVIEDNCGGIELHDAVSYAFRFGRLPGADTFDGEVGQFGVGMKRALFKLGEAFTITSMAPSSSFVLDMDVPQWLEDEDDWTLPMTDASQGIENAAENLGTTIEVTNLLPSVATEFAEEYFLQRLRAQIEFRHQPAIAAGLEIKLNGNELRSRPLALLFTEGLSPRVVDKELDFDGDEVRMRLYSGFVELQDEDADTDDPDKFSGGSLAGWYLVCNGRMLLFADRTRLTGWGVEVADYHPQYRRFRGYVYLTGPSAAMPWNTAKTTVDEDSSVWRAVRSEIVDALREARTVMNRIKTEVQEQTTDERPVSEELGKATQTPLSELPTSPKMVIPPRPKRQPPTTKGVTYKVPTAAFKEVAASLGVTSAADVGRETFDYYYSREIED
jgi:hypothetical protein